MSSNGIVESVRQSGVVGAGGGGFPTHVKLSARAEVVILNAAECEPLLHKDEELMRVHAEGVVSGLQSAMEAVSAQRGIIGIKGKHVEIIEALRGRLPRNIDLVELRDSYPSGDEFILVYDALGRIVPPGGLPMHVGAVVINVETALNIEGACSGRGVIEKFLTVGGAVVRPSTFKVPIGISYGELIEAAGGATVDDPAVLVGGAMMGKLSQDLSEPATKTCTGLIVLSREHPLIQRRLWSEKQIRQIGRSACDQCSYCTELCPRYLLGHPIEPHKAMRSLGFSLAGENLIVGTLFCCECNLCTLYACPEDLDPSNVCVLSKGRLARDGVKWPDPPTDARRAENVMPFRRVPVKKLTRRIGLWEYRDEGPLRDDVTFLPREVVLPLKQHAGVAAQAVVEEGQKVGKGDLVGKMPEGKLGANVHASIEGVVESVDQEKVVITW